MTTKYQPFVGWTKKEYKGNYIVINEDGDRIHENHTNGSDTIKHAAFLGGSTAWGTGSADDETIPAFLDALNTDLIVHNFGEEAYNSRQELAKLINLYLDKRHFDSVIFLDGANEVTSYCIKGASKVTHHKEALFRKRIEDNISGVKNNVVFVALDYLFIKKTNRLINALLRVEEIDPSIFYDCDKNDKKANYIAHTILENWKIAHALVNSKGGRFIAILQPNAFVGNPQLSHLKDFPPMKNYLADQFKSVYPIIQKLIAEENLPWIYDLTDIYNSEEYIYIDYVHVSPNGNLIMAKRINQILYK